jgi:hypothetical protein
MQRLRLVFAPAFVVLLLLLAACGGGGSSTPTTAPAGTTAPTSTTPTASTTAAATATGTATDTGGASATPADTGGAPTTMPDLPAGATAVSEYHVFPNPGGPSILYTANITTPVSSDATAYWYSYQNGQWLKLQQAYVTGLREQQVQGSFDTTPPDLIVLVLQ